MLYKILCLGLLLFGFAISCAADENIVEKPAMIAVTQWGSDPLPLPVDRRHKPQFLTIHHAGVEWKAGSDAYEKIRNLQSWGKKTVENGGKDWPDLPYHFFDLVRGAIFEGRPTEYEPETNTSYDVHGHVGIQLWGNFEEQRISPQQVEALVQLTAWLSQEYDIADAQISGHKDVAKDTSCPGADFYRYLEDRQFFGWVQDVRDGKLPTIELGPALEEGPTEMIPLLEPSESE